MQGRSLALSSVGAKGLRADFHSGPHLVSRSWTESEAHCCPGLATTSCGTICGIGQTCMVSGGVHSA